MNDFQNRPIPVAAHVSDRVIFVRAVYLWLMGGFGVATLAAVGAYVTLPYWAQALQSMGNLFFWLLLGAQMGAIFFAKAVARRRPLNMVAYALFTGISGYVAGMISILVAAQSGFGIVAASAGMTGGAFLALTLTAFVSKKDFSFLGSFVAIGIAIMFFGGLIAAIFHLSAFSLVVSAVAVIACSAKILYDTSAMLRTTDMSDPAGFALSLFVSLYNIFISLLNLLSGGRRN